MVFKCLKEINIMFFISFCREWFVFKGILEIMFCYLLYVL